MSRGHNITHCQYCRREYLTGDCITNDCELGHDRKSCQNYQNYIRQQRASAVQMEELARKTGIGKAHAGALLMADLAWDTVAENLTDSELAEELKHKVWANQKIGSEEIALVTQAIERLLNKNKPLHAVKG